MQHRDAYIATGLTLLFIFSILIWGPWLTRKISNRRLRRDLQPQPQFDPRPPSRIPMAQYPPQHTDPMPSPPDPPPPYSSSPATTVDPEAQAPPQRPARRQYSVFPFFAHTVMPSTSTTTTTMTATTTQHSHSRTATKVTSLPSYVTNQSSLPSYASTPRTPPGLSGAQQGLRGVQGREFRSYFGRWPFVRRGSGVVLREEEEEEEEGQEGGDNGAGSAGGEGRGRSGE